MPNVVRKIKTAQGVSAYDKDTVHLPRQDLPGMMKSLKSSYKT